MGSCFKLGKSNVCAMKKFKYDHVFYFYSMHLKSLFTTSSTEDFLVVRVGQAPFY